MRREGRSAAETHLVVEPALGLEMLKELGVGLAAPELEVPYLEITPNCMRRCAVSKAMEMQYEGGRTVTSVVGEPAVIREVIQGIVAGQVLGVLVHKL